MELAVAWVLIHSRGMHVIVGLLASWFVAGAVVFPLSLVDRPAAWLPVRARR